MKQQSHIIFFDSQLNTCYCYSFLNKEFANSKKVLFKNLNSELVPAESIFVFLPWVSAYSFSKHSNETKEEYIARFYDDYSGCIIDKLDQQHLVISHDCQNIYLVNKDFLNTLNTYLSHYKSNVYVFPEYFLLNNQDSKSLFSIDNRLIFKIEEQKGFSCFIENSELFFSSIDNKHFPPAIHSNLQCTETDLIHLQHSFLDNSPPKSNFFKLQINLEIIKKRLFSNQKKIIRFIALISLCVILPFITNVVSKNFTTVYKANTLNVLKQLDPNISRVVNFNQQFKQIKSNYGKQATIHSINYIDELMLKNLTEIISLEIDFNSNQATLEIKSLSSIKYNILKKALSASSLKILKTDFNEKNKNLSGNLTIGLKL